MYDQEDCSSASVVRGVPMSPPSSVVHHHLVKLSHTSCNLMCWVADVDAKKINSQIL